MAVTVRSMAQVVAEEKIIDEAVKRSKKIPKTTDETAWRTAMLAFHDHVLLVRQYMNTAYPAFCDAHPALKTFRAAYGDGAEPESKEAALAMQLAKETSDMNLIMLLLQARELDTAMEYEATKLGEGYESPVSWYVSFSDELGPYNGKSIFDDDTGDETAPAPEVSAE